ncbi:hypothetical protein SBV1_1750019 [Verrucomicrobia bacterium]|nr:hypothetical protein SBV1_1750019 [Verrucomicrobiota bacterium]
MDSEPEPLAAVTSRSLPKGRRWAALALAAAVVVLVVLAFVFILLLRTNRDLIWLTPDQMARIEHPGPLLQMRRKLTNLTRPLWQPFRRMGPNLQIKASLFSLSGKALDQVKLPAAPRLNSDGTRAWILAPNDLAMLEEKLKEVPSASNICVAALFTANGVQSRLSIGETLRVGANSWPIGLTVDVVAKFAAGSVKASIGVISTQRAPALPDQPSSPELKTASPVITNLATACRVLLPNGGGLLVDSTGWPQAGGTNYWVIISPTAVDSRGQPIKR